MLTFIATTIEHVHRWDATAIFYSWAMGFALALGVLSALAFAWGVAQIGLHWQEIKRWL